MNSRGIMACRGEKTLWVIIVILMTAYLGSIFWINFHSALWYGSDMFTYSYEGRLMHDHHTLFPDNWVYSNQYHIISSPNLAALFLYFCQDSTTAMAFASSLFTLCILFSFLWCIPSGAKSMKYWVGALCMIGGTIFGYSAATYISGLQVLYTMCSYYSCYLIGILLSLGCWFRLKEGSVPHWSLLLCIVLLNFALGMQSLREILILNIPLLIQDIILHLYESQKAHSRFSLYNRTSLFVIVLLLAEVAGHLFMESLHVPTTPNIDSLHLTLEPSSLLANFWAATKNLLRISGLAIASDNLHYLPLSIGALFIALFVLVSLIRIFRTKDTSPLANAVVFSFLSILCVFGVGVSLMHTRDIYYFVYWLLAALSVSYVIGQFSPRKIALPIALVLLLSIINYGYSFLPDYIDYRENGKRLESFTQSLIDRKIEVIYVDASPVFAAASKDRIVSQSFWFDVNQNSGYPLTVFPSDKHLTLFDDDHYENALICLSDYSFSLIQSTPSEYQEALMTHLSLYDEVSLGSRRFVFYRPIGRIINPTTSLK